MAKKTMRMKFIAALEARGEREVKRNIRHVVYSNKDGGHYYIGDNGSLRRGPNVGSSVPCSDTFKKLLLGEGEQLLGRQKAQPFKDAGDML